MGFPKRPFSLLRCVSRVDQGRGGIRPYRREGQFLPAFGRGMVFFAGNVLLPGRQLVRRGKIEGFCSHLYSLGGGIVVLLGQQGVPGDRIGLLFEK